ncbi:hypothetical protein DFJ77DRAFT_440015 [Powellomyces hirtus]|nr:hypothetical protein DFJ77DRAFT_440015 [Powellomyces hirtus]
MVWMRRWDCLFRLQGLFYAGLRWLEPPTEVIEASLDRKSAGGNFPNCVGMGFTLKPSRISKYLHGRAFSIIDVIGWMIRAIQPIALIDPIESYCWFHSGESRQEASRIGHVMPIQAYPRPYVSHCPCVLGGLGARTPQWLPQAIIFGRWDAVDRVADYESDACNSSTISGRHRPFSLLTENGVNKRLLVEAAVETNISLAKTAVIAVR